MRPGAVAIIAVIAALLGGSVALVLGATTGLTDGTDTTVLSGGAVAALDPGPAAVPVLGNGFDPAAIYRLRAPGVVTLYADLGASGLSQGSGFLVDRDGTILTNSHVVTNVSDAAATGAVAGARTLYVEFKDGERAPARILGWDLFSDVAVVKIDPASHALVPVPLGTSAGVVVGNPVAAIGSPFNEQSSLSVGVVSATDRTIDSLTSGYSVSGAIQTDAPINRGNSGGPLFDAKGRVIGINAQIRSTSGTAEGVGFAIPIDTARRALSQIIRTGHASYAYVGVTTQNVTPGVARHFGFAARRGALVTKVGSDTPASRAGIRGPRRVERFNGISVPIGGDLIVRIGSHPVTGAEDVSRAVTSLEPGTLVPFVVLRAGTKRETVQVRVIERPTAPG